MLDEQAGGEDVVAVDHQTVVGPVGLPADALAVVGAPDPGVVDDDVVAVDHDGVGREAGARAADADEHVLHGGRVRGVVRARADGAGLEQGVGPGRADVDEESGEPDTVDVRDVLGVDAAVGDERGQAQPEHHGVGPGDVDRLVEVIDAGGEEQARILLS